VGDAAAGFRAGRWNCCSALVLGFALAMLGEGAGGAVGLGLALAMSSTALVLPIAGRTRRWPRGAGDAAVRGSGAGADHLPAGRAGPQAAGGGLAELAHTLWIGLLVVLALLVGRFLLPPLFAQAARTKSPELFLSASLLVVIVAALATAGAGLSPIVGH
jgi:CPA2 family monovalent cation:H+ antiporter-2